MNIDFKEKSSTQMIEWFESCEVSSGEIVELELLQSDLNAIGYKAFVDLAQMFFMKMLTPTQSDANILTLRFQKLNQESSFQ